MKSNASTRSVVKHLKEDNKDCVKETKEHNKIIKRLTDEPNYRKQKQLFQANFNATLK